MANLYPVLLKNVEHISFGANLTNIIASKKQGEVVVKVKKLLVTYDGTEYESVDCQSVTVKFVDDSIVLDIVLAKPENTETSVKDAIPQTEVVVPPTVADTFMLTGDDLEAFELLSDFHRTENQRQKTENDKLEAYTLESGVFDIQDLTSVQNALLDIVTKEKQFIDKGYKVFKTNTPRFDYETDDNFKLIESAVLIKPVVAPAEIVEENK